MRCSCGSKSGPLGRRQSTRWVPKQSELQRLKQNYRFSEYEIIEFRERFLNLSNAQAKIHKFTFRENMGLLGLESGFFLADRIFQVLDEDNDDYITLDDYLKYFQILLYGSEEEKSLLTYKMIDSSGKGYFNFNDFSEMIVNMLHTWNNITGSHYNIQQNERLEQFIKMVFAKFDYEGTGKVTFENFAKVYEKDPQVLEIFDYFNKGIVDSIGPNTELDAREKKIVEDLEDIHSNLDKIKQYLNGLTDNLDSARRINNSKVNNSKVSYLSRKDTIETRREKGQRMINHFDSNIKRSIYFEPFREESFMNSIMSPTPNHKKVGSQNFGFKMDQSMNQSKRIGTYQLLLQGNISPIAVPGKVEDFNQALQNQNKSNYRKSSNSHKNSVSSIQSPKNYQQSNGLDKVIFESECENQSENDLEAQDQSPRNYQRTLFRTTTDVNSYKKNITFRETPNFKQSNPRKLTRQMSKSRFAIKKQQLGSHVDAYKIAPKNLEHQDEGPDDMLDCTERDNSALRSMTDPRDIDLSDLRVSRNMNGRNSFNDQSIQTPGFKPKGAGKYNRSKSRSADNSMIMIGKNGSEDTIMNSQRESQRKDSSPGLPPHELQINMGGMSKSDKRGLLQLNQVQMDVSQQQRQTTQTLSPLKFLSNDGRKPSIALSGADNNYLTPSLLGIDDARIEVVHRIANASRHIDSLSKKTLNLVDEIKNKYKKANVDEVDEEKKNQLVAEAVAHNIPRKQTNNEGFIAFGHQHWNLVLNMMLGIQMAVKSNLERTAEELSSKDFKLKFVFELVPRRVMDHKTAYKICKFFDYAPKVFNEIRKLYNIKSEDYLRSIGPESMLNNLIKGNLTSLSELTSTGKSGSFFYFSADGKYTLKTISKEEFHYLRTILRNYYTHIVLNPQTLIIKFFGLHKLRFIKAKKTKEKIYFIVMANVFHTTKEIHVRYDLKGSTYGRITKENKDSSIARKDLNIIKSGEKIYLPADVADNLIEILKKDSEFFAQNNIIDYSLLVGIHYLENNVNGATVGNTEEPFTKDTLKKGFENVRIHSKAGILSADNSRLYFFGIIDILTAFNARKKLEYAFKRVVHGKGISAIPAKAYAERFFKFTTSLIQKGEAQPTSPVNRTNINSPNIRVN